MISQTTTTSATPTGSSSVNAGAIAGGAVGGVFLLGAIIAFAWYKLRTPRVPPYYNQQGGIVPAEKTNHGYGQGGIEGPDSPSLRYPETTTSANKEGGVGY